MKRKNIFIIIKIFFCHVYIYKWQELITVVTLPNLDLCVVLHAKQPEVLAARQVPLHPRPQARQSPLARPPVVPPPQERPQARLPPHPRPHLPLHPHQRPHLPPRPPLWLLVPLPPLPHQRPHLPPRRKFLHPLSN
jgi:hypothetical protein